MRKKVNENGKTRSCGFDRVRIVGVLVCMGNFYSVENKGNGMSRDRFQVIGGLVLLVCIIVFVLFMSTL